MSPACLHFDAACLQVGTDALQIVAARANQDTDAFQPLAESEPLMAHDSQMATASLWQPMEKSRMMADCLSVMVGITCPREPGKQPGV